MLLGNLRQQLYEEKEQLRKARSKRRHSTNRRKSKEERNSHGGDATDVSLKLMNDALRDMCRSFKSIEQPFLQDPRADKDLDNPYDYDWPERAYYRCDLYHRFMWVNRKSNVVNLLQSVTRIQTRRMAQELADNAL